LNTGWKPRLNSKNVISAVSQDAQAGGDLSVNGAHGADRAALGAEGEQSQAHVEDPFAQSNGFSRNGGLSIEPWISADDLALALDVSTDWVYEKAASGELPSYKFGGHRRFRVSEVEDWASKCASGKMTSREYRRSEETLADGLRSPA
jgi:excisionase family DNA binding protein